MRVWKGLLWSLVTVMVMGAGGDIYQAALEQPGRTERDLKRDKASKPDEVLRFAGIGPGMVVADLFAGAGYYSEILSHVVGPTGKVYLHNNKAYEPYVGEVLQERIKDDRLANVVYHPREADRLELPAAGLDAVIMILSYHDIHYVDKGWDIDGDLLFAQIRNALKPGGRLLVVDHAAKPGTGEKDAQKLHRIDAEFAKRDIVRHGFRFEASSDVLHNPNDNKSVDVFQNETRRKTDRFVYLFRKPE